MSNMIRSIKRAMLRNRAKFSKDKTKAKQSKHSAKDAEQLLKELEKKLLPFLKNDIAKGEEQDFYDHIQLALDDIHDIIGDASLIYKRDIQLELELLKQLKAQITSLVKLHREFEQMNYPDKEIIEELKIIKRLAYDFFEMTRSEMRTAYSAAHGSESLARVIALRSNYAHRIYVLSRRIKSRIKAEKRDYGQMVSDENKIVDLVHHKKLKEYKELENKFHDHANEFQKISLKVFRQLDESLKYDTLLLLSLKHDLEKFSNIEKDAEGKGYALNLSEIHKHFNDDFKMYNEELRDDLNMERMVVQTAGDIRKAA